MRCCPLWGALACLGVAACVAPGSTTRQDVVAALDTRLDGSVQPRAYALHFSIDPAAERFAGDARIEVEIVRPLDTIVLHGRGLDVSEATVTLADGSRRSVRYGEAGGVARLELGATLQPQRAVLELRYTAPFAPGLVGLYRMRDAGLDYAATLFEAIDARRAFPCFDEPRFKTPFEVVLEVPAALAAIANTPAVETLPLENGRKRVRFAPTPPLPTYLVAVAVGPFVIVDGAPVAPAAVARPPVPLRFLAPRGGELGLAHARVPTTRMLQALEAYFDAPYAYAKLDIVALPEYDAGAMENVGAISFATDAILLEEPVAAAQARAFAIDMAHELAHQWFGNLVTMPWWDDLWLNESFASWLSYAIVAQTYAEHEAPLARLSDLRAAIAQDALASARRMREPIRTEHDIENAFDDITYDKGAAVLQMFERYVGADVFRAALRGHMTRFAERTADAYDLIDSLERASGKALRGAVTSFIEQPGIPQVDVMPRCAPGAPELILEQSRYRPLGSRARSSERWEIPVCVHYGVRGDTKEQCALLLQPRARVPLDACPDWLLPNADFAGYYHWSLPPEWYARLAGAVATLPAEEGLAIADSVEAGFESGRLDAATALRALAPLASTGRPEVAMAPAPLFVRIIERLVAGSPAEAAARAYAGRLYSAEEAVRAFDPAYMRALASDAQRVHAAAKATFLARTARDAAVRSAALERAQAWLAGGAGEGVAADALETALEILAQDGDEAQFEALLLRFERSTGGERETVLTGLARATRPERAARLRALALGSTLNDDERRTLLLEQAGVTGNGAAAWAWLKVHFDELAPRMPSNHAGNLPAVAEAFCDRAHAAEAEAYFASRMDAYAGGPRNLAQSVERIELCAALREAQAEGARAYFASHSERQ